MYQRLSIFGFIIILVGIIFGGACKKDYITYLDIAKNNFPVATIDGNKEVMASDLFNRMADSKLLPNGGIIDSTILIDTLREIVLDSVVSIEAMNINIEQDPGSYRTYLLRYRDFYMDYIYKNYVLDSIQVDSLAVDSFYWANPDYFSFDEQVHARQLVVSAEGLKEGKDSAEYKGYSMDQLDSIAREEVFDIRKKIDNGADFGEMAFKYSMHRESGDNDGELGYFFKHTFRKEFEKVAFSLPEGTISQPFKTPDGWHLVQVLDHIDSGMVPLTPDLYAEATQAYSAILSRERGMALMDSLIKACQIEYNDSALVQNLGQVPETTWAAIINDVDTITFERLPDFLFQYKSTLDIDTVRLQDVKDMLFQLGQRFLLMQFGDKIGYSKRPEVAKERESIYHKYAMNIIRNTGYDPNYTPPESLVEKYYTINIDKYIFKKPIYVQHIIVDDSLLGEYLRDQALSGVDFLDLAEEYYPGEPEIRRAAADLGYIGPGEMPDAFYNTAMSTRPGNVSHPVKTDWGYHIIKVVDKKNNRPLNDARFEIIEDLKMLHRKQAEEEWKQEILARHDIVYHLDKMAKIKLFGKNEL
jgi:parvulin-like peptidyl-prolyl isomerase